MLFGFLGVPCEDLSEFGKEVLRERPPIIAFLSGVDVDHVDDIAFVRMCTVGDVQRDLCFCVRRGDLGRRRLGRRRLGRSRLCLFRRGLGGRCLRLALLPCHVV